MCDLLPANRQGAASFEGVRLLSVIVPMHLEVGPAEGTWSKIAEYALTPIDTSEQCRRALRLSGLEYVDMWARVYFRIESLQGIALCLTPPITTCTPHARALVAAAVALRLSKPH